MSTRAPTGRPSVAAAAPRGDGHDQGAALTPPLDATASAMDIIRGPGRGARPFSLLRHADRLRCASLRLIAAATSRAAEDGTNPCWQKSLLSVNRLLPCHVL